MGDYAEELCPAYHCGVEIIGRRWSGAILQVMLAGASHFAELERAIPDISSRMLSERLKELETEGIVERTVTPDTPVRVEYRLSAKGRALGPVVKALQAWADKWVAPRGAGTGAAGSRGRRRKKPGPKRNRARAGKM